ncbi:hypothetical protein WJX82_011305 [Trebouxia sp. C0006]
MGAAISHSACQSRQASQTPRCAQLLNSCCQGLPDLRQYRLASMRLNPCLQQWSTLCTGNASDISNSNDSVKQLERPAPKPGCWGLGTSSGADTEGLGPIAQRQVETLLKWTGTGVSLFADTGPLSHSNCTVQE